MVNPSRGMLSYDNTRLRRNGFVRKIVRSQAAYAVLCRAAGIVMVLGLLASSLGMWMTYGSFSQDWSALTRAVGASEVAPAAAAYLIRWAKTFPAVGADFQAETADDAAQSGFLPYRVQVSGLERKAPVLSRVGPDLPEGSEALPAAQGEPSKQADGGAGPFRPIRVPGDPDRIVIPKIGLDAPVEAALDRVVWVDGQAFEQWQAPDHFAAGWQEGSAPLGMPGNTVLNGHHNIAGSVFGHLYELAPGDRITAFAKEREFHYVVSQTMKLAERDASLEQRQENARWILSSDDERLTLVTCWPPTSNTQRLIIVAIPVIP